jgi:hypothetical protein
MQNTYSERSREPFRAMTRRLLGGLAGLTLAVTALQIAAPSAEATTSDATCVPRTTSTDWKGAIASANTALSKALTKIENGHYDRATKQLRIMKRKTQVANTAATALIGLPPTDPESDDPPGPTAVLKVAGLDHKITMALVPLFGDSHGVHVVAPLGKGLLQADTCRDMMLDKVMALNAGKLDDYVDGLSDTLPVYQKELTAIAHELAGDALTAGGRDALTQARQVVTETDAAMESVFGGGERSPR